MLKDRLQKLNRLVSNLRNEVRLSVESAESSEPLPIQSVESAESSEPILNFNLLRRNVAFQYLRGSGIEIGPLHQPLEISSQASVRYVDRMPVEELKKQYPELSAYNLVEPDILDDGEVLSSISDDSVDFVIANHMIEHCQNPIAAIENFLRVLKPNGVLYMAVPDKKSTFDLDRPVTSLEHLIRDYKEGPAWSMYSHFEEYARLVDKVSEDDFAAHLQNLIDINYSIHFHVWTDTAFLQLLLYCKSNLYFPFDIELFQKNDFEFILVLRKNNYCSLE
jgi:predicted SAM-dependent methyltransferase